MLVLSDNISQDEQDKMRKLKLYQHAILGHAVQKKCILKVKKKYSAVRIR